MHKSRQVRNSKTLSLEEIQKFGNDDEEDDDLKDESENIQGDKVSSTQGNVDTEEEYINRRLKELDMFEEGMSLMEKNQILKSVDASMNTAKEEDEIRQNFTKSHNTLRKANDNQSKNNSTISIKAEKCYNDWINPKTDRKENHKSSNIREQSPEIKKDTSTTSSSHVQVFERESTPDKIRKTSSTENEVVCEMSSGEDSEDIFPICTKKRPTTESKESEMLKRLKVDVKKIEKNHCGGRLKIFCKLNDSLVNARNISEITQDLDTSMRKWKLAMSKQKHLVFWSKPIIPRSSNSCTVSSDYIPRDALQKYQEYLVKKGVKSSVFYPEEKEECVQEPEIEPEQGAEIQSTPVKITDEDELISIGSSLEYKIDSESSSHSNNDDDGWLPGGNRNKKKNRSRRQRKQNTRKIKQNIEVDAGNTVTKLNGIMVDNNKFDFEENSETILSSTEGRVTRSGVKKTAIAPVTMSNEDVKCPVCSQLFEASQIEIHATECARKTYED